MGRDAVLCSCEILCLLPSLLVSISPIRPPSARDARSDTKRQARAPFLSVSRLLLRALLVLYMYRALGSDGTWARAHVSRSPPPPPPPDYDSPSRLASGQAQRVTQSLCSAFFSFLALLDSIHTRTVHPSLEYARASHPEIAPHMGQELFKCSSSAGGPERTRANNTCTEQRKTRHDSRRFLHYTVE